MIEPDQVYADKAGTRWRVGWIIENKVRTVMLLSVRVYEGERKKLVVTSRNLLNPNRFKKIS